MLYKSGLLVPLVLLVAHVASAYFMDDRNATISYSPSNKVSNASSSIFYDGTQTWIGYPSDCSTSDNCQMSVPFTGSGITLYAGMQWALSFNISIDGTALSRSHFDGVYGCCNATVQEAFNFTIYDIQNLPLGNHVLVLRLLDTSGNLYNNTGSVLFFDYAVVNEIATPPSPSPSPIPQSPSPSPIPQSSSPSPVPPSPHKPLAPIIGGALGGTAVLALVALAGIYIRRRARNGDAQEIDAYSLTMHSEKPEQGPPVIMAGFHRDSAPVPSVGEGSNTTATAAHQLHAEREVPPATTSLTTSPSSQPPHPDAPSSPPLIPRDEAARQVLGTLYDLGVPGTQIASLVETMRQTTQGPGSGILANESTPPPYGL